MNAPEGLSTLMQPLCHHGCVAQLSKVSLKNKCLTKCFGRSGIAPRRFPVTETRHPAANRRSSVGRLFCQGGFDGEVQRHRVAVMRDMLAPC
jgi:hypothetical protein